MSIQYVSLEEQKEYSKIQHCAIDDTITLLIKAASSAVKNYLKDFSGYQGQRNTDDDYVVDSNYEPQILLDSQGDQEVKPEVKMAVMLEVDRRLNPKRFNPTAQHGYLCDEAIAFLYPLRDPALK